MNALRPGPAAPDAASALHPMLPEPMRITKVTAETRDTFTLRLDPGAQGDGFPFAPGQFNMLYHFGAGEVAISISGDPGAPEELVHTIRAVGSVTGLMAGLKAGDVVGVRGPYGTPWPMEAMRGHDVMILAGGLGLAPLRPAIYHLLRHRADYGQVALLVGARSPEDLPFRKELERWQRRKELQTLVTVDHAGPGWTGPVGVVPSLIARARVAPERAVALVCGPEVMMKFSVRDLERQGMTDDRIFVSMERNMKCAVAQCGHCQYGPHFLCKDGPVLPFARVRSIFSVREI
ncbi:MAG: FAD/NAD(P)-binding protein [Deltaproteobacteria bacterium]|nr:FAD/NAD(P)-binding protein [Deltaproteobacteria bacterium]